MIIKNRLKKKITIAISIFTILLGTISPSISVLAKTDANAEFDRLSNDYIGDSEKLTDVIEKFEKEIKTNPNPGKTTMTYVMKRLFDVGVYINDVDDSVLSEDLKDRGVTKDNLLADGRYACNPNAPNNLINHNCNIPNFTTGLLQNFAEPITHPFNGAEKTSSYSTFGFGVPDNIPGGVVPATPGNRANTYTALELYGYDLRVTSYNGEWDRITVSNQARMLSNFGVIDNLTLMGTGLWNSIKGGVSGFIEGFSFNPMRWMSNISNIFDGSIAGGLNTILDTSDLNIVATNGWKRESFSNTLYNVYVLTDKEVLTETSKKYFRTFSNSLKNKAEGNEALKLVLSLEEIPGFTFKVDWETEESIKAREAAEAKNASEQSKANADIGYSAQTVPVPDPVYYTEKEQLGFWAIDNQDKIDDAIEQGLISGDPNDYESYEDISAGWKESWDSYFAREFNALGDVVNGLIRDSDKDVFAENPHLDPKQQISHYACANDNGSIMRDSNGNIEYLYTANNKGKTEFLNPKCKEARTPIGGALFGSGWHVDRKADTRHRDNINNDFFGVYHKFSNALINFTQSFNSFIAKLTNTILGLSFSPILSELGIDEIIASLVESFKNTIFFPMAALVAVIGALMLFLQILKNGSSGQLIISISITFLIFIAGAAFFMTPGTTVKIIDELPSKLDNFLADAVLVDDDGTSYCTTGSEKNGIRSAQCNVWGATVFNPWVHLQFGTGYDNLHAKGFAPPSGSEMKNTNADLVGNAEVYLGGGVTVNNWALYQLDKTKAGTINDNNISSLLKVGTVDKNMYRLVDLQAGPNNGEGTDQRFFSIWSGVSGGDLMVLFMTTIQAIMMLLAIAGLGVIKIETSFMFAINILFLPFVLLFALLPQGKVKLKGYIANLISLLIKRSIIVVMLAVLLKALNVTYSNVDSLWQGATISISICLAFLLYRKEILDLITKTEGGGIMSGDSKVLRQTISENIPVGLKHRAQTLKANVKGATAGFVGGSIGYQSSKLNAKSELTSLRKQVSALEKKENNKEITAKEMKLKAEFQKEISILEKNIKDNSGISNNLNNMTKAAGAGSRASADLIGRRTERKIRKEGHSVEQIISKAKHEVFDEGASSISKRNELTASDTYKEALSHSESNKTKTSSAELTREEGRILTDPKIQKEIRRLAKKRDDMAEKNKADKNHTALSPDKGELEALAKIIDKKRKSNKIKGKLQNPILEKSIKKESDYYSREKNEITTNVEDIKAQLTKKKMEDKARADKINKADDDNKGDE